MSDQEVVLASDGVTRVVRVGETVHRPVRPFTATVQAYLTHLHSRGFHGAPEALGYDEQGREVLSYVTGDVPTEPLPDWATGDDVLIALARLIRRLHDAAAGWSPPPGAVWGQIPGTPQVGVVPLFDEPELVSHMDYCPGNVVFRGGTPVALIDFDLARPTTRVVDLVNAMGWWVPLEHPADRPPGLLDANVGGRLRLLADTYGLTPLQRTEVMPAAIRRANNAVLTMRAAAAVDPVFRRWWHEGLADKLPRRRGWLTASADRLDAALRSG